MFEAPNFNATWHRGTKSFVTVDTRNFDQSTGLQSGHIKQELWVEATEKPTPVTINNSTLYINSPTEKGQQLPNFTYLASLLIAFNYALEHPDRYVHWIRYDNEAVVPENANNAPYRIDESGRFSKTMFGKRVYV